MSLFKTADTPPDWCELEHFDIIDGSAQNPVALARRSRKERMLLVSGECQVGAGARSQVLRPSQFLDLAPDEAGWQVRTASACRLVRFCGRWGEELGGCGLFQVAAADGSQTSRGDPVSYAKNTSFDSHYHDCDEYWIMIAGAGTVVVGDRSFRVQPGDAIAIGMGHHHDFPEVSAPVEAVYFETTLEGRKRVGHLWEHTHGPASPRPERI